MTVLMDFFQNIHRGKMKPHNAISGYDVRLEHILQSMLVPLAKYFYGSRISKLKVLLMLLMVPHIGISQDDFQLSYDIREKLKIELSNSSYQFLQSWYAQLDSLSDNELILAKGDFDSIVLIRYSTEHLEPLILFGGHFFDTPKKEFEAARYTLSHSQVQFIMDLLNNPNNYDWSSCGSPIAEHELQFYESKTVVLRLVVSCDYSQIHLSEKNSIIKFGALKERGENTTLRRLVDDIKTANNKTRKE